MQIPAPPKGFEQWALETSNFIIQILTGIVVGQQTVVQKVERLQMSMDDVAAEVATLKSNVAAVGAKISSEIADLADASAKNDPAKVQSVLDELKATNAQLFALGGKLDADDKPAAPPAA